MRRLDEDNLARLKKELQHADVKRRRISAEELSKMGKRAKGALPQLTRATFDRDRLVRFHAVVALGFLGRDAAEAIPALLRILHHSSKRDHLHSSAASALGLI